MNWGESKAVIIISIWFPALTCKYIIICRLSWVQVDGTTYKQGCVVVTNVNLVPTFGLIKEVIVFETDVYYLVCEILFTEYFCHHYHSYKVCKHFPPVYDIHQPGNLSDHITLSMYTLQDSFYIPLKHQLTDTS